MTIYPATFSLYTETFGVNNTILFDQMNQSVTLDLSKNTVSITALQFNSSISDLVIVNVTSNGIITQYFVNSSVLYVNFSFCQLIDSITLQSKNTEQLPNILSNLQLILCYISPSRTSSVRKIRRFKTILILF